MAAETLEGTPRNLAVGLQACRPDVYVCWGPSPMAEGRPFDMTHKPRFSGLKHFYSSLYQRHGVYDHA
jgi:hypothetical protein